jgi:glycosyltransferase involved in cell wall biosynthesis
MPSKLESFGFPYYEAMALGLPLVAADKPFAREACSEGALYAQAGDADGWIQILETLLKDESARDALAAKGLKRFEAVKIDWPEVARRYLETLASLKRR